MLSDISHYVALIPYCRGVLVFHTIHTLDEKCMKTMWYSLGMSKYHVQWNRNVSTKKVATLVTLFVQVCTTSLKARFGGLFVCLY